MILNFIHINLYCESDAQKIEYDRFLDQQENHKGKENRKEKIKTIQSGSKLDSWFNYTLENNVYSWISSTPLSPYEHDYHGLIERWWILCYL